MGDTKNYLEKKLSSKSNIATLFNDFAKMKSIYNQADSIPIGRFHEHRSLHRRSVVFYREARRNKAIYLALGSPIEGRAGYLFCSGNATKTCPSGGSFVSLRVTGPGTW